MSCRVGLRYMQSVGGKALCKVDIVVQENTTPNPTHMVTIAGVNYHNGDTAALELGDYPLTWTSGDGGVFDRWSVSGDISVSNSLAESTILTVTCGGTLTLNLSLLLDDCDVTLTYIGTLYEEFPGSADVSAIGQAFRLTESAAIGSVQFKMRNPYGATGTLRAALYNSTGTFGTDARPTGSALAQSNTVSMASLPSGSYEWIKFVFPTPPSVSANTVYCICVEVVSYTTKDEIWVGFASSNAAHPGNVFDYWDGWENYYTRDCLFKLYGSGG